MIHGWLQPYHLTVDHPLEHSLQLLRQEDRHLGLLQKRQTLVCQERLQILIHQGPALGMGLKRQNQSRHIA